MSARFPARLHVLFAPTSHLALVIRRGPSRHVCTIQWNRRTDKFRLGQWLYGRIYERRCDLSPNGEHFIYFAMNGRWDSKVKGAWTAISRAPYLKALSLFPKGDCWHGGGLFLSDREYWLNDGYGHELLEDKAPLTRCTDYPGSNHYGGECPGVYYLRLQRDGWQLKGVEEHGKFDSTTLFEKRVNDHWILRKNARATIDHPDGKGAYFDRHEIVNPRTGEVRSLPDWEWAEVDGGRVVWAERGKLFASRLKASGLTKVSELYDFNDMVFERIQAPY